MYRHILPNAFAPVIVAATLSFGSMILTESALSFLGFGVATHITWGKLVADARDSITTAWHPSVFPPSPSCSSSSAPTSSATGSATSSTPASADAKTDPTALRVHPKLVAGSGKAKERKRVELVLAK